MKRYLLRQRLRQRAPRVPRGFSGVFIRGFPPNKKTTRQRDKTLPLLLLGAPREMLRQ
jgi:hypothetical protein